MMQSWFDPAPTGVAGRRWAHNNTTAVSCGNFMGPWQTRCFGLSLADRQDRQWVRKCLPALSFAFTDFVAVGRRRAMAERLVAKRIRLRGRPCRDILDCRPSRRLWPRWRQSNVPQFIRPWPVARAMGPDVEWPGGWWQKSTGRSVLRRLEARRRRLGP